MRRRPLDLVFAVSIAALALAALVALLPAVPRSTGRRLWHLVHGRCAG